MKAIQVSQYGDYEQLRVVDLPMPDPGEGQVMVKMTAAAINPLDDLARQGKFPVPLPFIPSNEGVHKGVPIGCPPITRSIRFLTGLSKSITFLSTDGLTAFTIASNII